MTGDGAKPEPPLIVTACFDERSFAQLDALRRRHFPTKLNRVPAHISLFHHLPSADLASILATIAAESAEMAPLDLEASDLRFLGRGVAIAYESHDLLRLHGRLARAWSGWLTAQDRQPFRAHVTIQNKTDPARARSLLESLRDEPLPSCRVEGLTVWRYLGGPWDEVETVPFGRS